MADNSLRTFPSVVERARASGFPRGFIGANIPTFTNTFVAPIENNPIHADGMAWAKKYVADRSRINKSNMRNYDAGGSRNYLSKPQPQGSFFRIQGNSGSNHYGFGVSLTGQGGAFRTKPGADYGRRRLRQRGEQLEQMAMEAEMGIPVGLPGTQVPTELTEDETKKVALGLAISSVAEDFTTGDYNAVKRDDVLKIFNSLRTDGLKLSYDTLDEYYETFVSIITDIRANRSGRLEGTNIDDLMPKSIQLALYRIFLLLSALISSINLEDRERKAYISSQVKRILKVKSIDDMPLTELSPGVLETTRQRLPARALAERPGERATGYSEGEEQQLRRLMIQPEEDQPYIPLAGEEGEAPIGARQPLLPFGAEEEEEELSAEEERRLREEAGEELDPLGEAELEDEYNRYLASLPTRTRASARQRLRYYLRRGATRTEAIRRTMASGRERVARAVEEL